MLPFCWNQSTMRISLLKSAALVVCPQVDRMLFRLLAFLVAAFFVPTVANADLIYDWEFGSASGTIQFSGVDVGTSHVGVTPASIIQNVGPTSGNYSLHQNIITQLWPTNSPAFVPWNILADGTITNGGARFVRSSPADDEVFLLGHIGDVATSRITNATSTLTSGGASFSLQSVPEPSSLVLIATLGIGLSTWRRRRSLAGDPFA